jgi:hypothetical protein
MGEFPIATIGAFDFYGEDHLPGSSYFGLHLSETMLIAHLMRKSDGREIHITRPVALSTSAGLSLSVGDGKGGIYQDASTDAFLRGGVFSRELEPAGSLRLKGWGAFWSGGSRQTVDVKVGDEVAWEDSGRFSLQGQLIGPGLQTYVPSRRGLQGVGVCHTGVFYEASGTVLGEPVAGIVIVEHVFTEPGEVLSDTSIRTRFAGGWNGFATVFEDGSTQYGHIGFGVGPFRFMNVVEDGRHTASAIQSIRTETGPEGLGKRAEYLLANGDVWEFVTTSTLVDMLQQARAMGSSAQLHKGYVQRPGEERPRRNWYSIQEWVPERMQNDSVEAVAHDVPRGF